MPLSDGSPTKSSSSSSCSDEETPTSPSFTDLNNLSSEDNGGKVVFATDDWFAVAENLLKNEPAVWEEGLFTEFGKWMDGWETRRKRITGHDWCVISLGLPGCISGFEVDTSHFTGNYAPKFSIQAATLKKVNNVPERISQMGTAATEEELSKIKSLDSDNWETIVPISNLKPGYANLARSFFAVSAPLNQTAFTHIRLNLYPDGGVARLKAFGVASRSFDNDNCLSQRKKSLAMAHTSPEILKLVETMGKGSMPDLLAMESGASCIEYSNAHYGHPRNLIRRARGINMGDGWETARRLDRPAVIEEHNTGILNIPGQEHATFKMALPGRVVMVETDTLHFKGNYADSVEVQLAYENDLSQWTTVLEPQKLSADKRHYFLEQVLKQDRPATHARVIMRPDGGISRIRLYGKPAEDC